MIFLVTYVHAYELTILPTFSPVIHRSTWAVLIEIKNEKLSDSKLVKLYI